MQTSNVSTPINGNNGRIFVALELSQRSWLVTIHSPDRDRMSRHKLEGGDHVGLLALIERVRERARRVLGSAPVAVSCYEAGYDGFWLHRLLTAAGITNHVLDPASIAVDQRARRAKTDRIDGETLVRTLMAYKRGEPRVCSMVCSQALSSEDSAVVRDEFEDMVGYRGFKFSRAPPVDCVSQRNGEEPLPAALLRALPLRYTCRF